MHTIITCSVVDSGLKPSSTVSAILADPKGAGSAWFGMMFSCHKNVRYNIHHNFKHTAALWSALAASTAQLLALHVVVSSAAGLHEQAAAACRLLSGAHLSSAWSALTAAEGSPSLIISKETAVAAAERLGPHVLTLLQLCARNCLNMGTVMSNSPLHKLQGFSRLRFRTPEGRPSEMRGFKAIFPDIPRVQYFPQHHCSGLHAGNTDCLHPAATHPDSQACQEGALCSCSKSPTS